MLNLYLTIPCILEILKYKTTDIFTDLIADEDVRLWFALCLCFLQYREILTQSFVDIAGEQLLHGKEVTFHMVGPEALSYFFCSARNLFAVFSL